MKCDVCGNELNNDGYCEYCNQQKKVRVMSREERDGYSGTTINETNDSYTSYQEKYHDYQQSYSKRSSSPFIKVLNFNSLNIGWLTKIALILGVLALLAFLAFVVLPVAAVFIAVAVIIYMIMKFISG